MGSNRTYTQEQENFLEENYLGISRQELTDRFNEQFNENRKVRAIKAWCNRRGLFNGNDGLFKTGNESWQKGLSAEEFKSHYTEESFNSMTKSIMDKRQYKIGDEVIRNGKKAIIVSIEKNKSMDERTIFKSRFMYLKYHGEIPENHRIIHLDGNLDNFEKDNLYCLPIKFVGPLNKNKWLKGRKEITLTAIKWLELLNAVKEDNK